MIKYSAATDMELADLLRAGDDVAFKVIYQKYWDKLLVVAGRRLSDIDEAEEAIQDIFLNLWKRRESFHLKVGFDKKILLNTLIWSCFKNSWNIQ